MSVLKYGAIAIGGALALVVSVSTIQLVTSPLRTAGGIVDRTLDPANVLGTYERFHDTWKAFDSRLAQINSTKKILDQETDQGERRRLRMEMAAQQQSCRDIAAKYNADAAKTNRSIFMGREAPTELNNSKCEVN
jgi:ABC-type bacteriocin/lantibiotic exporter with double-glycine peptidase domain